MQKIDVNQYKDELVPELAKACKFLEVCVLYFSLDKEDQELVSGLKIGDVGTIKDICISPAHVCSLFTVLVVDIADKVLSQENMNEQYKVEFAFDLPWLLDFVVETKIRPIDHEKATVDIANYTADGMAVTFIKDPKVDYPVAAVVAPHIISKHTYQVEIEGKDIASKDIATDPKHIDPNLLTSYDKDNMQAISLKNIMDHLITLKIRERDNANGNNSI